MMLRSPALLLIALAVAGCALQRAQDAETAQRAMLGFSKERVFACMGIPKRKAVEGNVEIWAYDSGNGRSERFRAKNTTTDSFSSALSTSLGFEDDVREKRFCTVQVVMTEGKVSAVNYNGPTGGFLTEDEQCAFATRNCMPH